MENDNTSPKYPGFKDILLFLGAFIFAHFVSAGVLLLYNVFKRITGHPIENLFEFTDLQLAISYLLTFGIIILLCLLYRKNTLSQGENKNKLRVKFGKFSPILVLWGYLLILAIGVLIDPLGMVFPESLKHLYKMTDGASTYMMLTMVIFAPVLEEILFRGIVQGDLTNRYRAGGAIFIASLLFGLVHMQILQSINAFFAGLVMGLIYYRSGSLWCVILIHMLNNALSIVLGYVLPEEQRLTPLRDLIGIDWLYYTIYAFAAALTIMMIVKIILLKNNPSENIRKAEISPVEETDASIDEIRTELPVEQTEKNDNQANENLFKKQEKPEDTPF